jgi:hypothetical protein
MKHQHIISLIENTSFGSISESDLETIKAHVAECDSCENAFAAARLASVMLRERTAETFEPSPFFQTRVMAHLRERQAANTWDWSRIWRATGALASSMVATVVALAILTFVVPDSSTTAELVEASARNAYSVEEVILNPGDSLDEVSDGHILTTLYDAAEDTLK